MSTVPDAHARQPAPAPGATAPLLEVDGLTKRFGGVLAVSGATFSVAEGSITGLIGPNGSGKTTVFNMVTGYLEADAGQVRFAGDTIRHPNPRTLYRRGLSRTFQQARVFPQMTLIENLVVAVVQPTLRWVAEASDARTSTGPMNCSSDSVSERTPSARPASSRSASGSFWSSPRC